MEINKCPMCGSSATIDSSAAAEYYGYAMQSLSISCDDEFEKKCDMSISINADFGLLKCKKTEKILVKMWKDLSETNPIPT